MTHGRKHDDVAPGTIEPVASDVRGVGLCVEKPQQQSCPSAVGLACVLAKGGPKMVVGELVQTGAPLARALAALFPKRVPRMLLHWLFSSPSVNQCNAFAATGVCLGHVAAGLDHQHQYPQRGALRGLVFAEMLEYSCAVSHAIIVAPLRAQSGTRLPGTFCGSC